MPVHLPGVTVPQGATVAIRIELTAQVNITPFVARQKVTRFVVMEISTQLLGDAPELIVGERLCWSVPVLLTSPLGNRRQGWRHRCGRDNGGIAR